MKTFKQILFSVLFVVLLSNVGLGQISVTPGTSFNLDGQGSGIYATRPTSADFSTGTGEVVLQIVTKTFSGAAIDFDGDGNREIVVQTVGNSGPTTVTQTRLYIFEAEGNNDFRLRSSILIDAGLSGSSPGLMRGVDVGDVDGDGALEIVSMSGAGSSSYLTIYDINTSTFAFTELAQQLIFATGGLIANNGTINQVKIVSHKNGATYNDILISNATGSTAHIVALEYNGTSGLVLVNGAGTPANSYSTVNSGVIAFDHRDMGDASDEEIVMVTELAGNALVIREYVTSGTTPFGTAKTISTNWTGTTTGSFTTVSIGDIDGDGDLDAVAGDYNGKQLRGIRRTGADTYTTEAILGLALAANSPPTELSDIDNDGKIEIIYSNGTSVVYREHDGTANDFTSARWGSETTILSGLGSGTANALSFVGGSSTTLDNDRNFDVVVGRSAQVTDTDMDADELFFLEANRLFTSGTITSGNYDNVEITVDVSLGGNVTVNGTLTLTSGLLNLGANNLTLGSAASISGTPTASNMIVATGTGELRKEFTATGSFTFPIGDNTGTAEYSPVTVNFVTGSFAGGAYAGVNLRNTIHPNNGSVLNFINRYWTLTSSGITSFTCSPTFTFLDADVGGLEGNKSSLYTGQYNSGWTLRNQASGNNLSATTISSFSDFTGGDQGALPVNLQSFSSVVSGNYVKLNWITAMEENNAGFDVERVNRVEGIGNSWQKIGFVSGSGTKNTSTNYSFEDKNLQTGKYKYRLKQIDHNGNYEYFELSGEVEVGVPKKYDISQNYPNPFNPVTKINFDLPENGLVNIRLYDMLGREVAVLVNEVRSAGYHTVQFDASKLSSGIYFYKMNAGKFSGIKKMSVIK